MKEGRILKAYGGYFFVYDFVSKKVYQCGIRGRLKKDNIDVIAGDLVKFTPLDDDTGVVEGRLDRKNSLFRPVIANVEQVVIVFAIKDPKLDYKLLDRLLVLAEVADLEVVICINKIDLVKMDEVENIINTYKNIGYKVFSTSVDDKRGINDLKEALKEKVSVFAGPSGVGKSSLLNTIQPGLKLKTGEVSKRIKRGKHTTRHVELLSLDEGGWVADTPGFSLLDLSFVSSEELQYFFPEMIDHFNRCKFKPCSHSHEPKCGVKDGVKAGDIAQHRHQNYLEFLKEIAKSEEKSWRR